MAAANAAAAGLCRPGRAPLATSVTVTGQPAKTSSTWARRLLRRPVGGEPVVHGDHALVRDHVAGHAAAHADRVQPLVVGQPVDVGLAGLVVAQDAEDRAGVVDGVAAHPGPGAVRALPGDRDLRPQRALAAALDHPAGRLHQHGEVAGQLVRHRPAQPQQPVALGLDFLAVVEHVGHVTGRSGDQWRPAGAGRLPLTSCLQLPQPYSIPFSTLRGNVSRDGARCRCARRV